MNSKSLYLYIYFVDMELFNVDELTYKKIHTGVVSSHSHFDI